jgi:hypothetical protein
LGTDFLDYKNIYFMALSERLEEKLSKSYPAKTRIDDVFKGNAITFITNDLGEPVTLFIGKRREDGAIKGERYVRKIVRSEDGTTIIKSHWDNKGKVSRGQ